MPGWITQIPHQNEGLLPTSSSAESPHFSTLQRICLNWRNLHCPVQSSLRIRTGLVAELPPQPIPESTDTQAQGLSRPSCKVPYYYRSLVSTDSTSADSNNLGSRGGWNLRMQNLQIGKTTVTLISSDESMLGQKRPASVPNLRTILECPPKFGTSLGLY